MLILEELTVKSASKDLNRLVLFESRLMGPGGEERLLWEEEKFFREKGIETMVLTFSLDESALFGYKPQRVEIIEAHNSRLSQVLALRRRLRQIKPDLVIASSSGDAMYLYLATMFTSLPYLVHIYGTLFWFPEETMKYALIYRRVFSEIRNSVAGHKEFISPKPNCSLKKRIASEFLAVVNYLAVRKAGKITVLTEHIKWEVNKLYGRDSIVVRGCVPPEVLSYQPKQDIKQKLGLGGKRIILNIGRLDPRKRIDLLITAFAKISPRYQDIYLVIGGTGEEEEKLKRLTEELGIGQRVKFLGFIPDSELFDYYAACDVFAFPSWTSFGITRYEALALDKKILWTTELNEPISKDSHVFLADPNVEDFSRGLEEALNASVKGKVDLSKYTCEVYFETVYAAAREAFAH